MGKPIEEEIKQTKFRNSQHKLAINLMYTTNWINTRFASEFKKYQITNQQYNVLRILRGQHPNPCKLNLVKERMLDKTSDVSRIVERLRKAELIERVICNQDRRAVDIKITDQGLKLLKELDSVTEKFDSVFKNLNESEFEKLNGLLDKLRF